MMNKERRQGWLWLAAALALQALACKGEQESRAEERGADAAVEISPSNIALVVHEEIRSGPTISGALAPRREAEIRAEIGGSVLQVYADKGQPVGRNALLARIDDSAVRDSYLSARSTVSAAKNAGALARRNLERAQALSEAGAISDRDLEQARLNAMTAQSQLADANARLAAAQKQLDATQVRAPFAGVISDRPVNAGDVVTPGSALFTMMDPASGMKFEAAVPPEEFAGLRVGAPVQFRVNGFPGRVFNGSVERINPTADPATGQIGVYVGVPGTAGLVGGLYAEGRVGSRAKFALTAPLNALITSGDTTFVMRVKASRAQRVQVRVGIRDEETERAELIGQLAAGDTLLVGAAASISPNSPIRVKAIADRPNAAR
jgi:RND family efflux transporter MFP subunit